MNLENWKNTFVPKDKVEDKDQPEEKEEIQTKGCLLDASVFD